MNVPVSLAEAQAALASQPFSVLLGARLMEFGNQHTCLELDLNENLMQQHGVVHGGVVAYLVDNAVAFAAGAELGPEVVTGGISVDYLTPATAPTLRAVAWVVGRSPAAASVRCDVFSADHASQSLCAVGHGRGVTRRPRGDAAAPDDS